MRRKIISFLVTFVLLFTLSVPVATFADSTVQSTGTAAVASLNSTEQAMIKAIDAEKADLAAISKNIWNLKEVGLKEVKSAALLEDKLTKEGFTVVKGLTGLNPVTGEKVTYPTAFSAAFEGKKGGPTVAILLEYDALPNGHSCGHNLIAQTGLTAAIGLKEALKSTPGKLIVFGTPDEEGDGSKEQLLDAGYFKDVDVVFATHGSDKWSTEVQYKAMNATNITFTGKASHASAAPWVGRSSLDAAMLMGQGFEFMREHMFETDRIHYVFLEGGKAANVVPEKTVVQLYVRSNDSGQLGKMLSRADTMIKAATMMTETTAEYKWGVPLYAATQVPYFYDFAAKSAASLNVVPYSEFAFNTQPGGSSDAGNIGYLIPTVQFAFPVAEVPTAGHTTEFNTASSGDYAISNSHLAGKMMAVTAYQSNDGC